MERESARDPVPEDVVGKDELDEADEMELSGSDLVGDGPATDEDRGGD